MDFDAGDSTHFILDGRVEIMIPRPADASVSLDARNRMR